MFIQYFFEGLFAPLPKLDQTDRIQGMARYMNEGGSSLELGTIFMFLGGMLGVIIFLRIIFAFKKAKEKKLALEAKKRREAERKAADLKPNHKPFRSLRHRR